MRILFIGDIVGKPGRKVVKYLLPGFIVKNKIDFVIANGENLASGAGITEKTATEMFDAGVSVLTGGNHSLHRSEGLDFINRCKKVIIPLNMARGLPGRGFGIYDVNGTEILIVNLIGQVFMGAYESPFYAAFDLLDKIRDLPVSIVDFHAEATAEKLSFLYLFGGRFSAILGTHTHVQTNDERIENGTAYITDVGMTGGHKSVIGVEKDLYIKKMVDRLPVRFKPSDEGLCLNGVLLDIDTITGHANSIEKINIKLE